MKLLMLSNYFTPDLSAGSFRMQALVDALEPWSAEGLDLDLITTRPNRYASLRAEAPAFEDRSWIRVHRIEIPSHKSGMADQARAYIRYAQGVRKLTRSQQWDAVFATSSRLMTAGLGAHISQRLDVPLYLDIRDLFTDNMDELLAGSPIKSLMPVFRMIERRAFGRASRINVVSQGFASYIKSIAPRARLRVLTNGIDSIFSDSDFRKPSGDGQKPLIVYAGNMGEGQGLHRIVPQVARRIEGRARFRLIGDGGQKSALEAAIAAAELGHVELLPPVPRANLLDHYREADILFLHLNDLDAFRKVLPSKVFEYAATEKPILAGVAGHAAEFLSEHLPDAEVFEPLDADAMTQAIDRLLQSPPEPDRTEFREAFARSQIMERLASDIIDMIDEPADLRDLA
ncbi:MULTISPECIES: glycosyltransferase family 4 protein [unclassified Erythrobacter]|uniref:glycosyltransferase family 4 protein n=1 Tax=unclassified Erythrobacter TaxID=2633097 RepID=UPI00076D9661|nr:MULTISPECIES: glycosyltransferase family 4 protein [unclassified Erythrobacter]KWV96285.1 glycosyltransferase WbuB [Erythrobacter sp. AP23]MBO6768975.1 glycosyltransferase family 4 protein [Erythrobacter sp.]